MKKMRMILIAAAALLSICFIVQLMLSVDEMRTLREARNETAENPFIADVVPQHPVGMYHALSLVLLLSVMFAKRYLTAFFVATGYMLLNCYATYQNLRTGSLGGNICPEGGLCWRAIGRASWFDWSSAILLLLISCLLIDVLFLQRRESTELPDGNRE